MPTLEDELRATMVEASEHLQLPAGTAERAWRRGHRAAAERSPMSWRRTSNRVGESKLARYPRGRLVALTGLFAVVAVIVTAFALGGKSTESGGPSTSTARFGRVNGLGDGGTGGRDWCQRAGTPGTPARRALGAARPQECQRRDRYDGVHVTRNTSPSFGLRLWCFESAGSQPAASPQLAW